MIYVASSVCLARQFIFNWSSEVCLLHKFETRQNTQQSIFPSHSEQQSVIVFPNLLCNLGPYVWNRSKKVACLFSWYYLYTHVCETCGSTLALPAVRSRVFPSQCRMFLSVYRQRVKGGIE